MIIHDASGGMIHGGSPKMSWGSGAKNLTARKSPDMLGSKMGTKMVPVRALKAPSTISRAKFRGDAIRDDGRSPNPLFLVETASFWADFFCILFVDFCGAPNNKNMSF